jgi:hypothetical protein
LGTPIKLKSTFRITDGFWNNVKSLRRLSDGAATKRWILQHLHPETVLAQKGGFQIKNATYNAHVSQLFPLQSRIVTKGLFYFILSDQNKLHEIGCSHTKMLVKLFSILNI